MRVLLLCLLLAGCAGEHLSNPEAPRTWYEERWGEVAQQELDSSCGLASLVTIMRFHLDDTGVSERTLLSHYIDSSSAEELAFAMQNGLSLLELEQLAQGMGYITRKVMLSFEDLGKVVLLRPVLVYLDISGQRHFAVVRGISERDVWLADSARGNVRYSHATFLKEWRVPSELQDKWSRPGGMVLFRDGEVVLEDFLKEPDTSTPPAFQSLRRELILNP